MVLSALLVGDSPLGPDGLAYIQLGSAVAFVLLLGKKVKGAVAQRAADIQVALDQADVARKAAEERAVNWKSS